MTESRYRRFERRQDNIGQVISAGDINPLQETLESAQRAIIGQKDTDFLHNALFTLDHNPKVNALWIDLMEEPDRVDVQLSQNAAFAVEERGWAFAANSDALEALIVSKPYQVQTRSQIRNVLLMASANLPAGCTTTYEVTTDGLHWSVITPSLDNVLTLSSYIGSTLRVRLRLRRENVDQQPILYGWALLYHDPKVGVIQLDTGDYVSPPPPDDSEPHQPIYHQDLLGIGPDDHHPRLHHHDGQDGSGLVSHLHLTDMGPDDHHPMDHYHGHDGVSAVRLEHDITGTLPLLHHSPLLVTGYPGKVAMSRDPSGRLSTVIGTDSETYLDYDSSDRLSRLTTVYTRGPARGLTAITTVDYSTDPPSLETAVKDAQKADIPIDEIATP